MTCEDADLLWRSRVILAACAKRIVAPVVSTEATCDVDFACGSLIMTADYNTVSASAAVNLAASVGATVHAAADASLTTAARHSIRSATLGGDLDVAGGVQLLRRERGGAAPDHHRCTLALSAATVPHFALAAAL